MATGERVMPSRVRILRHLGSVIRGAAAEHGRAKALGKVDPAGAAGVLFPAS